jgi:hypothetical protein
MSDDYELDVPIYFSITQHRGLSKSLHEPVKMNPFTMNNLHPSTF